jgi:hypothetical protein
MSRKNQLTQSMPECENINTDGEDKDNQTKL